MNYREAMLYNCGVHIIAGNCSSAPPSSSSSSSSPYSSSYLNPNVTWPSTDDNDSTKILRRGATGSQAIIDIYITSPLIVIGVVCNTISIVVLRRDKERHGTVFFLQALSAADTLYLLAASLRYPLRYLLPPSEDDHFIQIQPVVFPLLKTFQTITIWMMVLVTVHRFVCVCAPLTSPLLFNDSSRRCSVVVVFCTALLYNVPRFFDSCVYRWYDPCTRRSTTRMLYRQSFSSSYYYDVYIDGLYIVLLYIGPLTTIILINCRLVQAIRYSRQRSNEVRMSPGGSNQWSLRVRLSSVSSPGSVGDDRSATVVLLIVVVVFVICETPELILKVVSFVDRNFDYGLFSMDFIRLTSASQVLMVFNSSVNFFIYVIFGRRFRRILRDSLFHFAFRFRSGSATRESLPELRFHHNCVHDQGGGGGGVGGGGGGGGRHVGRT